MQVSSVIFHSATGWLSVWGWAIGGHNGNRRAAKGNKRVEARGLGRPEYGCRRDIEGQAMLPTTLDLCLNPLSHQYLLNAISLA